MNQLEKNFITTLPCQAWTQLMHLPFFGSSESPYSDDNLILLAQAAEDQRQGK